MPAPADTVPARTLRIRASRYWYSAPIVFCIAICCGALLYCCTSYDALATWYSGLSSCIYKGESWRRNFFTPAAKATGNLYAIGGICIAIAAMVYFARRLRRAAPVLRFEVMITRPDVVAILLLYVFGAAIWLYGALTAYPSYDEVFSLMNCARLHPLQTGSYYPLPNNHVLFNLLNALPAHFWKDGVVSGRIISGLACAPLIGLVYCYLRAQSGSRYFAAISVAVLMLQFIVWAFSVQARGYALYLAASWASFIFLDYYLRRGAALSLALHGFCIVAGFWTVPSFLLWEAALVAYIILHFIRQRSIDSALLRTHLVAAGLVYLIYLPVLLFSGRAALLENGYVKRNTGPLADFLSGAWEEWRHLFQYAFAYAPPACFGCDLLLVAVPLIIYALLRKKCGGKLLLFYILLWSCFWLMELRLRHLPPFRNLIAHQSLSLTAILMAVWMGLGVLLKNKTRLRQVLMTALCTLLAGVFVHFDFTRVQDAMYGYNLESSFRNVDGLVHRLPPATKLGTSPESFYPRYACLLRGIAASECMGSAATMYIKRQDEIMPSIYTDMQKVDSAEDYEVFAMRR